MSQPSILIISASLNPASRSLRLAKRAEEALLRRGSAVRLIELRELQLPICDGDAAYSHSAVGPLAQAIQEASAVLLAAPVYNYDLNAAAKNLVELTGEVWTDKLVGFLCAAGGAPSYMSPMGLANSLMLDFHSLIVPRFVYARRADFEADGSISAKIQERIEQLAERTLELANALRQSRNS